MTAPAPESGPSLLLYENRLWAQGRRRVAGIDEAGRGPLAGPVVAAAVVFDPAFAVREEGALLRGLTDSKKLTVRRREAFFEIIDTSDGIDAAVGLADTAEIDRLNILEATHLAMKRAAAGLSGPVDYILVDGRPVEDLPCEATAIVGGDARSLSIAAASVMAKVVRDRLMRELDRKYPQYGFAAHKGYGTHQHMRALFEHGPSPVHRRSFRPVREAAEIVRRSAGCGEGGRQPGRE
jgi:ribonuclease HII